MTGMGAYSGYVFAAYVVAAILIGGLTTWTIVQGRAARRELQAVEDDLQKLGKEGRYGERSTG